MAASNAHVRGRLRRGTEPECSAVGVFSVDEGWRAAVHRVASCSLAGPDERDVLAFLVGAMEYVLLEIVSSAAATRPDARVVGAADVVRALQGCPDGGDSEDELHTLMQRVGATHDRVLRRALGRVVAFPPSSDDDSSGTSDASRGSPLAEHRPGEEDSGGDARDSASADSSDAEADEPDSHTPWAAAMPARAALRAARDVARGRHLSAAALRLARRAAGRVARAVLRHARHDDGLVQPRLVAAIVDLFPVDLAWRALRDGAAATGAHATGGAAAPAGAAAGTCDRAAP
jgi:hypothetical protein